MFGKVGETIAVCSIEIFLLLTVTIDILFYLFVTIIFSLSILWL